MAITTTTNTGANSDLLNVFPSSPSATLTWDIPDIRSNSRFNDYFFSSKCSYSIELIPSIYELTYYDSGSVTNLDGFEKRSILFLRGCFREKEEEEEKLPVQYRFSILNSKGERYNSQEGREFVTSNGPQFKTIAMFTIDHHYLNEKGFSIDGKVTFYVEIFELSKSINSTEFFNAECLSALSKNQLALLESGKGADVVLVAGDVEFKVHKLILSTHSPAFDVIFDHQETMVEGKVEIPDMSADVLQDMLRFIYTGQVLKMEENAAELFKAAQKYQLLGLKTYCEKYLSSTLTMETAPQILQMANLYGGYHLKYNCLKYIADCADPRTFKAITASNAEFTFELVKMQGARALK